MASRKSLLRSVYAFGMNIVEGAYISLVSSGDFTPHCFPDPRSWRWFASLRHKHRRANGRFQGLLAIVRGRDECRRSLNSCWGVFESLWIGAPYVRPPLMLSAHIQRRHKTGGLYSVTAVVARLLFFSITDPLFVTLCNAKKRLHCQFLCGTTVRVRQALSPNNSCPIPLPTLTL